MKTTLPALSVILSFGTQSALNEHLCCNARFPAADGFNLLQLRTSEMKRVERGELYFVSSDPKNKERLGSYIRGFSLHECQNRFG